MRPKTIWVILKDTAMEWQEDKVPLWAAALAFYTIFSIAPLLIIVIAIAGAVFGREAAHFKFYFFFEWDNGAICSNLQSSTRSQNCLEQSLDWSNCHCLVIQFWQKFDWAIFR